MLQRAASNVYSWWWASHIRTKQSKWLDNNLQEMEEKVKAMMKLIQEDADSFARKAELYFRRRPVLLNFVEETYKAYKALADIGTIGYQENCTRPTTPLQLLFLTKSSLISTTTTMIYNSPKAMTAIDTSNFTSHQQKFHSLV